MATNLPPVPYKTPMLSGEGFLTSPWQGWFRQLVQMVVGASQIDATTAAANAEAAEAAAASSASVAGGYATTASGYSTSAGASATGAASSATAAAASATSAATSATAAQAAVDAAAGSMAFAPDYITSTVTVPVHRQFIAFQRVTIASGGSLQILGRGRIL